MTKMLFPTLTYAVEHADKDDVEPYRYMTFMVACFMRMFAMYDDFDNKYKIWDPFGEKLEHAAKVGGKDPEAFLEIKVKHMTRFLLLLLYFLHHHFAISF